MRYTALLAIFFLTGCQKIYLDFEPKEAKLSSADAREVLKAERLGEKLYLQDTIAAKATRMMFQVIGPIKPGELSGWIVVKDGAKDLTRFFKQTGEDINVIYDVRIEVKGDSEVTKDNLRPLSKPELAMIQARQMAIQAAPKECTRVYNTAVMEDIDSTGWLVYILAATNEDVIVVGGHSRIKVSADGKNILAVTPLYDKCLFLKKTSPPDSKNLPAVALDYPIGDVPSEIHVFLNLLHGYPLQVTTSKGIWLVKNGNISLIRPAQKDEPAKIKKNHSETLINNP